MNTVAIGVGSNIDPNENISKAKKYISKDHSFIRSSRFVKTKPVGYEEQDDFMNGAFLVKTDLDKVDFINYLKDLENKLGRIRTHNKNGPRTIDLDVVIWNNKIIDQDCYEREFLKNCLNELGFGLK